ncbi:hypothetical protein PIB30_090651 [Stylosanthes scabra]|uniref:Uncharacterized protein n=1 Tax=Stylosanthes scabra TaxID=79078 RepID=A0ABU6TWA2_9FABA|nr:hypothetical protein [Stylosanthes scabra]
MKPATFPEAITTTAFKFTSAVAHGKGCGVEPWPPEVLFLPLPEFLLFLRSFGSVIRREDEMVMVAGLPCATTAVGYQNRRRCHRNPPPVRVPLFLVRFL